MWCVGKITAEYRQRMENLLALYARPYNPKEPVVCVDEKSKQLLAQTRRPIAAQPGALAKEDYEYKRAGTRNIFLAVEPKGGRREAAVTARRTKVDFVGFMGRLVEEVYAGAEKIQVVLDNLALWQNLWAKGRFPAAGGRVRYAWRPAATRAVAQKLVAAARPPAAGMLDCLRRVRIQSLRASVAS